MWGHVAGRVAATHGDGSSALTTRSLPNAPSLAAPRCPPLATPAPQVAEGKGENSFAFGAQWLGAADALSIIDATHRQWQRVMERPFPKLSYALYGEAAAIAAAAKGPWLPPSRPYTPRAPTAPTDGAAVRSAAAGASVKFR